MELHQALSLKNRPLQSQFNNAVLASARNFPRWSPAPRIIFLTGPGDSHRDDQAYRSRRTFPASTRRFILAVAVFSLETQQSENVPNPQSGLRKMSFGW